MPADAAEGFHQFHHREELPRRLATGTGALEVGHLARVAERSRRGRD